MPKIETLTYTNERGESVEFSHRSVYHTDQVSGLSDMRNAIYSYNSMGQDGETYLSGRVEAREIEIVGDVKARGKDAAFDLRRSLTRVLNPKIKATLTYRFGDFCRVIDCYADNAPVFAKNPIFMGFTVQLACLNPFWREEYERRDDIAAWVGDFEFELEIPIDEGIEMGHREPSLIYNVYNGGDVDTGMTLEIRAIGAATNPEIINIDTGRFIRFRNLSLAAGDVLIVGTSYGKKRVTLSRGGVEMNAMPYWDTASEFLQLAVGDNLLRYDAVTGRDNIEIIIAHDNLYLGV